MDLEADEAAVSQMMGFSSFGMKDSSARKRRHDDEAGGSTTDEQPPSQVAGDGPSNPAPSQRPSHIAAGWQPTNTDEISLDDDDGAMSGVAMPETGPPGGVTLSRPAGLPDRPPPAAESMGPQYDHQPQQGAHRQRGRHANDSSWYKGYYDLDSNHNPWERLERARGLQPRGSWVLRDLRMSATPSDAT